MSANQASGESTRLYLIAVLFVLVKPAIGKLPTDNVRTAGLTCKRGKGRLIRSYASLRPGHK
jgi:hypothetical protein